LSHPASLALPKISLLTDHSANEILNNSSFLLMLNEKPGDASSVPEATIDDRCKNKRLFNVVFMGIFILSWI
jgi:hypothetical protein